MNKRGSLGLAIMSAFFIFIIGFATINLIIPEVTNFRINMDCSNSANISNATKMLCLVADVSIPYWILIILSITIGGIIARFAL